MLIEYHKNQIVVDGRFVWLLDSTTPHYPSAKNRNGVGGFRQGLMCRESCVRWPPSLPFFARREVRMRLQTEQKWLSCNKNLLGR